MAMISNSGKDERPRSPHVQIYRPQLTTVLSFGHRLSGIGLSAGSVVLAVWLVAAASGEPAFNRINGLIGSPFALVLLFVWTYVLFFHLCNGIRHLFWDCVQGFDLRTIYASGWAVVVASIVLTVVAWGWALTWRAWLSPVGRRHQAGIIGTCVGGISAARPLIRAPVGLPITDRRNHDSLHHDIPASTFGLKT